MLRERNRAGIHLDFCADCKGVWLDRGELDKIVEREASDRDWDDDDDRSSRRGDRDRDRSERREDDDRYRSQGGYQQKSKKKSFFESLTDIVGGGEAD